MDSIWGTNLAGFQFISTCNKAICVLLCTIDVYTKYEWNIPLKKNKNLKQLLNHFKAF